MNRGKGQNKNQNSCKGREAIDNKEIEIRRVEKE